MGGGSKYKLIEYISGINIMEKYVDLKQKGTISEAFIYKKNGSKITQHVVSGDRVLGVLLEADTIEGLENKRTAMLQDCRVIDETGADILYRECFAE